MSASRRGLRRPLKPRNRTGCLRDIDFPAPAPPKAAQSGKDDTGRLISGNRAEWLSDEVAIDFPSVSSVLDRMRESFFRGEREAALSAEIVVTPQEAFYGTLVPLHVPLRRTCPRCGGRGEIWAEWCASCQGTGEVAAVEPVRLRLPPGVREGATFRFSVGPQSAPPTFVEVRITIR